ncbi:TraB/GumN family protein [Novosphingobium sp. ZN18A2]|uniref:TraB/GumN family protein n=1 Tax=Novosphingobium sp. ZN18A2 TaxID=3079861 RepID=UPI0030CCC0AC
MRIPFLARAIAAFTAVSLSATPVLAQTQTLPAPVSPTQVPAADKEVSAPLHPALWVVKDDDTTIYLFGTMHVLKPGLNWFNGPIARALDNSGQLVTEILDPTGADTQSAVLSRAVLPADKDLRTMMDDKQRTAYEALLARIKLPSAAFDRFKPWYVAVVLSSLPLIKHGLDPKSGAEALLEKKAREDGKPQGALETVDYQLGLFDSLPYDAQLAYLSAVVDEYDQVVPQIDALVKAWGNGDAEALAKQMNSDMDDPRLKQTLLIQRNEHWAKWIAERLAKPGTVFVAVGAGHLAGDGSVQDQLKGLGIKTARVQ